MLYQGEVDLAITSPKPRLDEPTDWNVLISERLGLAVPPDHRLAGRRRGNLFEGAAEPSVVFSPEAGRRQVSARLCRQAGFSPAIAFESGEVATVRAMVGAGL